MHQAQLIQPDDVIKIAKLANLSVQNDEVAKFSAQFSQTVEVVNQLNELDTQGLPETYQVTNLANITREDIVDLSRVLTQSQALSQAKTTCEGFFVVERVIDSSEDI